MWNRVDRDIRALLDFNLRNPVLLERSELETTKGDVTVILINADLVFHVIWVKNGNPELVEFHFCSWEFTISDDVASFTRRGPDPDGLKFRSNPKALEYQIQATRARR